MTHSSIVVWYWGRRGGGADFTYRYMRKLLSQPQSSSLTLELNEALDVLPLFKGHQAAVHTTQTRPKSLFDIWGYFTSLFSIFQFCVRMMRLRPSEVVVTMNALWAFPLLPILKRVLGFKLVYVVHDATPHPGDIAPKWQSATQARLVSAADELICLSDFVAKHFAGQGKAVRVERISTFFDPPEELRKLRKPLRLLFMGRMVAYKGLDVLAQALPLLPQQGWHLTLEGNGPMDAFVAKAFEHPNVSLNLQWVDENRIAELLVEHDVLLCPYTEASQSGVIELAKQAGLQVIVFDVGGLAEQLEGYAQGIVIQDVSAEGLVKAIQSLL